MNDMDCYGIGESYPFPSPGCGSMTAEETINLIVRMSLISPRILKAAIPSLPLSLQPSLSTAPVKGQSNDPQV